MGLASALTTALTGMTAAESQIDVAGNNLANSQTVGFKASRATFATQFLQTQSLGSAPTDTTGGTNPRQIGLGVRVAEVTPDFTQGTIQGTSSPSDLAIQGEGFFMVEGPQGERLYTRNGQFKTNSENELVTTTGQRVLGFGVDDDYNVESTTLVPLTIPLGTAAVARATSVVTMQGVLSPSGQVADTAGVIESATLGDDSIPRPDTTTTALGVAPVPSVAGVTVTNTEGAGGTHPEGATYRYRIVFADDSGTESTASSEIMVTTPAGDTLANNTITLNGLPTSAGYSNIHVYRTDAGGSTFKYLANAAMGGNFVDDNSIPLSATQLDTSTINGNYSYLVTYARAGEEESRPSPLLGPVNVVNGRVHLTNLPTPPVPGPGDTFPAYDKVRIYRNTSNDSSQFYLVDELDPGQEYTDSKSDAAISDLTVLGNQKVDLDGPKIDPNTLLVNVTKRDQLDYQHLFDVGTLSFTARKGGRELTPQQFEITATTTVQDLMVFMQNSVGIQTSLDDPQNPMPSSLNNIPGETAALAPGVTIQNGKIRVVSNNGVDNEVTVDLAGFRITTPTSDVETPSLGFGTVQEGRGNSAVADFVAYDTLGIPINVRVTTVLESLTDSATVYRWYADSPGNHPTSGTDISVGTGLITFDGQGNLISTTNDRVSIARRQEPSNDPLEFQLDFTQVSGLASDKSSLAAARQDGSAAGTLSSFIIGEDGGIRGVFSNGVTRDLGQIRLATFANPQGLEQRGQNMFAQGVNSGLPVEGNPGDGGTGSIIAGATELSNTDIGKNLIDLVLATTQYRGNARVITAAQQLLDELLNLRR